MDLVDYSESVFQEIRETFSDFAAKLKVHDIRFIPISALLGDNVVDRSENMPWYRGESLLDLLETIHIGSDRNLTDLRFPVQYVSRPDQNFRGYAGQVASGVVRKGDEVLALPSMKVTRVASIQTFDGELEKAFPPMSVTVTLEDEVDVSRGDMLVHRYNRPRVSRRLEAMLVWMDETPFDPKGAYRIKHTTETTRAMVDRIHYRVDVNTLHRAKADTLELNQIGRVVFTTFKPLKFDPYHKNRATGSFILIDELTNRTVGAGMIIDRDAGNQLPARMKQSGATLSEREPRSGVGIDERASFLGYTPFTLWLTGPVSSGKSEVAYAVERALFERGVLAKVLDGGSLRRGLNRELDFGPEAIAENLRRAAETARLLNESGLIAICSFVSPFEDQRAEAREMIGSELFHEFHLDVPISWCADRDETGLYQRAEKGEVTNLAGVDMVYETPASPDLALPVDRIGFDAALDQVLEYLKTRSLLP